MSIHAGLASLWKWIRGPLQWRALYWTHARFLVGMAGMVRNGEGAVLLCRHRYWPAATPWGLPGGYLARGETPEAGLAREVREETGGEVADIRVARVTGGYRLRLEILLTATWVGDAAPTADGREVMEARFFARDRWPEGLLPSHHALLREYAP